MTCARRFSGSDFAIAATPGLLLTTTELRANTWLNKPIKSMVPCAVSGPAVAGIALGLESTVKPVSGYNHLVLVATSSFACVHH